MQNSIFRNFEGKKELEKDWFLFEENLLFHGFVKEYLGRILKFTFTKIKNNIKFIITVKPIYFNLIEIDISFLVDFQIIEFISENLNNLITETTPFVSLVNDTNVYHINELSFGELCKNFPILKM